MTALQIRGPARSSGYLLPHYRNSVDSGRLLGTRVPALPAAVPIKGSPEARRSENFDDVNPMQETYCNENRWEHKGVKQVPFKGFWSTIQKGYTLTSPLTSHPKLGNAVAVP